MATEIVTSWPGLVLGFALWYEASPPLGGSYSYDGHGRTVLTLYMPIEVVGCAETTFLVTARNDTQEWLLVSEVMFPRHSLVR